MRLIKAQILSILLLTGCFSFAMPAAAQNIDINILKSVNPQNPNSDFWKTVTSSGYPIGFGLPVVLWTDGYFEHNKQTEIKAYTIAGGIAAATAATIILKKVIDRPRPYVKYNSVYPYKIEHGESLPSAHATVAFAAATGLALQYKKWYIIVPAYTWAAGVSYSRMYLGEHYPSDVLAGAAIGTGSALLSYWLSQKIFKHGHTNK